MMTRRQWGMALMAVGLAISWAGAGVADAATGGLPLCQANLATCTTTLATCNTSLGTCNGELAACDTDLGSCTTDLATCNDALAAAQEFPATGQTSCWDSGGTLLGSCAGTGHDGDIQAGAALSYTDNGDGTITDNNTKLIWEKKSDDGTIHDKDTVYSWANAFAVHVAGLNTMSFAGYTDWRLPNVKELQSIVNYQNLNPSVSSEFNTGCVASCTVLGCSCTGLGSHWSSSTYAATQSRAWIVGGAEGEVRTNPKSDLDYARAVRGGL